MTIESRDSIVDVWGPRSPYADQWPERVDVRIEAEPERWVQSCCVLCSNGCGLDIGVRDGHIVGVRGRADDRVNRGRLGPKGLHAWVANHSPDRLQQPLVRRGRRLEETTWDDAFALLERKTRETIAHFTAGAIGFYTSGQLFLEEYYTLAVIAHAGLGTNQVDGNTRLCTATSSAAERESFGADGQVACYRDVDLTDCLLHAGHNVSNTQTVLWSRILDRLAGPRGPRMVVIDPRSTATAKEADVHLAPKPGTNVAVMNGLQHLLIAKGHVDREFIADHTVGYEKLEQKLHSYTPERVALITGIPAKTLEAAAEILGTTPTLVSTVLQGFYQSNQATAASCQVNNLHLLRGLIGQAGSGVLQMNGQPTAQNRGRPDVTASIRLTATGRTKCTWKIWPASGTSMCSKFLTGMRRHMPWKSSNTRS
jgi:anaerobic selenocysteine-containing dehydrogenase